MRFLVDAQLPRRLARLLAAANHDAVHTLDLPLRNLTPDDEILDLCAREDRVLITKDLEFADSFFLRRNPARLLLVLTGNISNKELEGLLQANLARIVAAFDSGALIELDRYGLTIRA